MGLIIAWERRRRVFLMQVEGIGIVLEMEQNSGGGRCVWVMGEDRGNYVRAGQYTGMRSIRGCKRDWNFFRPREKALRQRSCSIWPQIEQDLWRNTFIAAFGSPQAIQTITIDQNHVTFACLGHSKTMLPCLQALPRPQVYCASAVLLRSCNTLRHTGCSIEH